MSCNSASDSTKSSQIFPSDPSNTICEFKGLGPDQHHYPLPTHTLYHMKMTFWYQKKVHIFPIIVMKFILGPNYVSFRFYKQRMTIKEAIYIRTHKSDLNRDQGCHQLPRSYKTLLCQRLLHDLRHRSIVSGL